MASEAAWHQCSEPTDTAPAPVVPPSCADRPIDLASALAIAGASNPTIGLAREAIRAARAEEVRADALLLPTLQVGADFNAHTGTLQSASGIIRNPNRESVYVGAGAAAVGAGPVNVPGVRATAHVADAIFEPRVARERVLAAGSEARATDNDILLAVAVRYFDLLGADARIDAFRQSLAEVEDVARVTANFARTGQGRQSDADRAVSEARLLEVQSQRAEEGAAVAAAELARLLDLDPATRLRPAGPFPTVVDLVAPDEALERLVRTAVMNRPEVAAASATVRAAEDRLGEERLRPFLPLFSAGYCFGGFGGGSDQTTPRFGLVSGRSDFDVLAVWSVENLGLGNRAVQNARRGELGQAVAVRLATIDRVRREVAEAYADVAALRLEMAAARQRTAAAERAYRADLMRTRNAEGLPIEVLNSVTTLADARQELIAAIVSYDQAQFRLFVALGQPLPAPP